jgi:hypothetical protein
VDPVLSSTLDIENLCQEQEPKKAAAINDERRHFTEADDEEDAPTVTVVAAADLSKEELPLPLSYYFPVPAVVVPPVAGGGEDQDTTTTISSTKPSSSSTAFSNVARRAHCFPSTTAEQPEKEETKSCAGSSKLTRQEFEALDDANKVLSSTANSESASSPLADRMVDERDDNLLEPPDDTTDLVLPKKATDSPPSPDDINLLLMMNPAAGSSSPPPSQQEHLLAKKAETLMKPNFASSAAPVVPKRVRHFQQHNYHDHSRNGIIIAATTNKSNKMIESTSTPSMMSRSATISKILATTTQSSCRPQLAPSSAPLTRPRRVGARLVTSENDEEQKQQEPHSQQTKGARRGPRGGVMVPFPDKLHHMLANVEQFGLSHIVSWQPHGRCFVVRDTKEFVLKILPIYFKQSKFTSFQRQLNLYGFRRLGSGPDRGGYYHELFLRGMPLLYKSMLRVRIKGRTKASCDPSTEPNFYAMPPIVAAITDSSSNDHNMKRVDGK